MGSVVVATRVEKRVRDAIDAKAVARGTTRAGLVKLILARELSPASTVRRLDAEILRKLLAIRTTLNTLISELRGAARGRKIVAAVASAVGARLGAKYSRRQSPTHAAPAPMSLGASERGARPGHSIGMAATCTSGPLFRVRPPRQAE